MSPHKHLKHMFSLVMQLLAAFALAFVCASGPAFAADTANANQSQVRIVSSIALAESRLPSPTAVRERLQAKLGAMTVDDMETDNKLVILFRIKGGTAMVGLLDKPLPKGEMDHMCKWAWQWRLACESMAPHKAHLLVSLLGTDLDKIDAALLQTHVVAALLDENAIASYWGTNLQSKEAFLKQSARVSRDSLPVLLWVNFRLTSDVEKGWWTISTDGMEAFDLFEIESKDANVEGRKIFGLVAGMAEYLIKRGPVIKDGETVGDSPVENIRVRQAPSFWREGKQAYRVVFPRR